MNASMLRGGLLAMVLCAALGGCGGPLKYEAKGTPRAPDADAHITAEVNSTTVMTRVTVKLEHLAPPDRIQPGATTYVAWARKNDKENWVRVGAVVYDADKRTGEMTEATVPLTQFEMIVSAEAQGAPQSPSQGVVVSQQVGM